MNGFIETFQKLANEAGVPESAVYTKSRFLELPGYFRPTKEWDLLIVLERHYDAAAFLLSKREEGLQGQYTEPNKDIGFHRFASALVAHLKGYKP